MSDQEKNIYLPVLYRENKGMPLATNPSIIAEGYLVELFGGINTGYIHLWIKGVTSQRSLFYPSHDLRKATEEAVSLAQTNDVYVGMCLRKENLGPHKRGSAEDICAVNCLWLDVDISGPAHKESNLPPDLETVLRILSGLPPYSILVQSGHGCYPVWLLDKPMFFDNKKDRDFAKRVLNRFHRAAANLFKQEGFSLDSVGDLPRILRLPGTINHKLEPVPVTFEGNGLRYTLDEVEIAIEAILGKESKPNAQSLSHDRDEDRYVAEIIVDRCPFLQHCARDAASLPEPHWFAMISVIIKTSGGSDLIHQYSSGYPNYSFAEAVAKIEHALTYDGVVTCQTISNKCGSEYCQNCVYNGAINSPLILGQGQVAQKRDIVFPIESLPEPFRGYAIESAEAICCPVDFVGLTLLVTAGGLIGDTCRIMVKPGWEESCGLYAAIIAVPSAKKSPALKSGSKFLYEFATILEGEYQDSYLDYREALDKYDEDIDAYEDGKLEKKPRKPVEPKRERLYTDDVTVEALSSLMADNPKGLISIKDELAGFTKALNQYKGGAGADRQFYLTCFNGAPLNVDRKGREPIILPRTFLSIIGNLPPDVLSELTGEKGQEEGWFERWIFVFPDSIKQRWNDFTVSHTAEEAARSCFRELYRIRSGTDPFESKIISISFEAKQLYMVWYDSHYAEIEQPDFPPVLRGTWGKTPGQVARLALIIHCCRDKVANQVTEETMKMAIDLGEYFKLNAKKVFNALDSGAENRSANAILSWMIRQKNGLLRYGN